jgi:alpha-1,2-mannosyltransferase
MPTVASSAANARHSLLSVDGLSEAIRERLLLGKLAGAAVWLAWLVSLALGGWTQDATGHRAGADHVQYYVVGRLVTEGGGHLIYDVPTMTALQRDVGGPQWEGVLPFRYPPFYALCFAPTSRLPYMASWLVWTALSLLALVFAARALGVEDTGRWLPWGLCFYPVFAAVSFGQNSLFSLAFLAATFALARRGRPFLAGMVAGLLLFKPQLLVGVGLLWTLDVRRSWRALLGIATTGCLLLGVTAAFIPEAGRRFVEDFGSILRMHSAAAMHQLYSTQGFWLLLLPDHADAAKLLGTATSLLGVVALVFAWRRHRDDLSITFAAAVLLTLWISPYAMVYDWSILLVPATLLWQHVPAERPRWRVLFAALWLVSFVSGPLVRAQLAVMPFAVQISVPVLAAVAMAAWLGLRASHSVPMASPEG